MVWAVSAAEIREAQSKEEVVVVPGLPMADWAEMEAAKRARGTREMVLMELEAGIVADGVICLRVVVVDLIEQ